MHLRQRLREIAVALVGDDDRRAGLGDEKIRARNADIRRKELARASTAARLGQQLFGLGEHAIVRQVRMHAAELPLDLLFV